MKLDNQDSATAKTSKKKIFIMDLDGTACEDIPNERWESMPNAKEVPGAREWINARYDEGNYICFFSARTSDMAGITERWLEEHGFRYHSIIYGKPRKLGYAGYHYIDNTRVQATTLKEEQFSTLKKVRREIEVFE